MFVYSSWWAFGPFTGLLDRHASIWTYRVQNGVGGSAGSSHRGTKAAALRAALFGMPAGIRYRLVTNGRDDGERIHNAVSGCVR